MTAALDDDAKEAPAPAAAPASAVEEEEAPF
jgi:hypothetical protein